MPAYSWLRKEIADVSRDNILTPDYELCAHDTLVPEGFVPVWLRKVFTKRQLLISQIEEEVAPFAEMLGTMLVEGLLAQERLFDILPKDDALRITGIATRAFALQNAFGDHVMGIYNLWEYPVVGITSDWRVFYRTYEQHVAFRQEEDLYESPSSWLPDDDDFLN